MDKRASDVLLTEGELEKVKVKWRSEGKREKWRTNTGGVRAALGKDRRSNEAGSDWSPTVDDTRTGLMGVAGVYGMREVEHGRPTAGSKGLVEEQGSRVGSRGRGRGGARRREGERQIGIATSEWDWLLRLPARVGGRSAASIVS